MRLKMKENSLFAILLRSPWWISFVIAAVIGLVAALMMPVEYRTLAAFSGTPFFIVGCMAAWRQLRAPFIFALDDQRDFRDLLTDASIRKLDDRDRLRRTGSRRAGQDRHGFAVVTDEDPCDAVHRGGEPTSPIHHGALPRLTLYYRVLQ